MRGIYSITNILTDTVYYGQSINIRRRLTKHKLYLKNNIHWNPHLQAAWNKYGKNAFTFEPCYITNKATLTRLENKYIKEDKEKGRKVYNIADPKKGPTHSLEVRKKISTSLTGKPLSEAHKKKLSESHKGYVPSEQQKRKQSAALKGRVFSKKHRNNMSKAAKGKVMSKEAREKMSLARRYQWYKIFKEEEK